MNQFPKPFNEQLELISELLEATLNEDGYQTIRFEETNQSTTAYRGIFIKDRENGKIYYIMINGVSDTEGIAFLKKEVAG